MKRKFIIIFLLMVSMVGMADNGRKEAYLKQWTDMVENAVPHFSFRFYNQKDISSLDAISMRKPIDQVFSEDNLHPLLSLESNGLKLLKESGITDETFLKQQRKHIRWTVWQFLLNIVHLGAQNYRHTIPAVIYDRVKDIVFDDEDILSFPGFPVLVNYYVEALVLQGKAGDDFNHYVARCAEHVQNETVRSKFIETYFHQLIAENHVENLPQLYAHAVQTLPSHLLPQDLLHLPADALLYNGKPAPDFTYEDVDGNPVTLSSLRGRFVLIDIWATWCGPCKRQMPFLKELEKELEGKNIVFLSLSSDELKDKAVWQQMVRDLQPGDISVIADNGFNSSFIQHFKLEYIPHFMLIAPDGTVASYSCRKPMDPLFGAFLRQTLKNDTNS